MEEELAQKSETEPSDPFVQSHLHFYRCGRADAFTVAAEIAQKLFTDKTRSKVGREIAKAIREHAKKERER